MKKRLDALTRIGRLQALMHDLGRWRLYSLARQHAGLNDDLKAAFEIVATDGIAQGVHAGLAARHVRALQVRLDQLAHEQDAARRSAFVQGTRAKLAELAIDDAALSDRRLSERKDLAELIERMIARQGASST